MRPSKSYAGEGAATLDGGGERTSSPALTEVNLDESGEVWPCWIVGDDVGASLPFIGGDVIMVTWCGGYRPTGSSESVDGISAHAFGIDVVDADVEVIGFRISFK